MMTVLVLSAGGQGEGISPFMLASYVDFMRAEAAMVQNSPGAAKGFILAGIAKSIAKVQSSDFIGKDPGADLSFVPTAAENTGFSDSIDAAFEAADTNGKMEYSCSSILRCAIRSWFGCP